jgi:hypothetical protein
LRVERGERREESYFKTMSLVFFAIQRCCILGFDMPSAVNPTISSDSVYIIAE